MQRIVKEGKWRYSGEYFEKLTIVEQDWDLYYEEGYSDFPPNLNEQGLVYFIYYGNCYYDDFARISARSTSISFSSIQLAHEYAENNLNDVIWLS